MNNSPHHFETHPFNTQQLASLCGIDKAKIIYHSKKGVLPSGAKDGYRLEWTLPQTREWVKKFRYDNLRETNVSSAVIIAIANFKGGVGKTTTSATLAQGLSLRGHRVLLIDADPQGSLTTLFGISPITDVREDQTILSLFTGEISSIMPSVQSTYWDGIDLVPASPTLFNAEFALPVRQRTENGFEFWKVLSNGLEEASDIYDVVIIDSPPALGYITINALMAANGILMPLPPSALDFASSAQFWNLFTEICDSLIFKITGGTKKYYFLDVLLSRVDKADVVSSAIRQWIMSAYGGNVLPIEIPKTAIAATASAEFGTVYDLDPSSAQAKTFNRARDAYDLLVEYIEMQMIGVWSNDAASLEQGEGN